MALLALDLCQTAFKTIPDVSFLDAQIGFSSKNLDFATLLAPFLAPFWHLFGIIFAICFQYRFLIVCFSIFLDFGSSRGVLNLVWHGNGKSVI